MARRGLGDLEAQIMDLLWSADEALSVRAVLEGLPPERNRAYTTVMTVLDNLYRKDVVCRERDGRAWRYRPAMSRETHVAGLMEDALSSGSDRTASLLRFVEQLSPEEMDQMRALLDQTHRGDH